MKREKNARKPKRYGRVVMGVIGIIIGLAIIGRNVSGSTGQHSAIGLVFGFGMIAAAVYSIVKKPKS